jgi:hypothetical protein
MDDSTGSAGSKQALRRVLGRAGGPALLDDLSARLSGADLTTVLLEAFRRRAGRLGPAEVMRRYRTDRFVAPGQVSFGALRRAEDAMLTALPAQFDVLTLAPVLPLGAHSAVAAVDPRNVIATIRGSEVAADPTNGLALEAADRRRRALDEVPRSAAVVRLAASQRVTRAQQVSGPARFAHFQLLGVITAGRDTGSHAFEREHAAEHLRFALAGLVALGAQRVRIEVTCLDDQSCRVLGAIGDELAGVAGAEVVEAPGRRSGLAYYTGLCFKAFATFGEMELEVADGGFVDWTQQLLGNRKERLLISGYGIERLAIASQA